MFFSDNAYWTLLLLGVDVTLLSLLGTHLTTHTDTLYPIPKFILASLLGLISFIRCIVFLVFQKCGCGRVKNY